MKLAELSKNIKIITTNTIVVTNVINVIYNFEKKNGLSKVIYAEKVIYHFFKNKLFLELLFQKKNNLLSVL